MATIPENEIRLPGGKIGGQIITKDGRPESGFRRPENRRRSIHSAEEGLFCLFRLFSLFGHSKKVYPVYPGGTAGVRLAYCDLENRGRIFNFYYSATHCFADATQQ
jgi:hypothetical protein